MPLQYPLTSDNVYLFSYISQVVMTYYLIADPPENDQESELSCPRAWCDELLSHLRFAVPARHFCVVVVLRGINVTRVSALVSSCCCSMSSDTIKAGFKRSMETITFLLFILTVKVFVPRCIT